MRHREKRPVEPLQVNGKGAHEPNTHTVGACIGFRSMKHAQYRSIATPPWTGCQSIVGLPAQQFVARTHLYTCGEKEKRQSGESFLSWETTLLARLEPGPSDREFEVVKTLSHKRLTQAFYHRYNLQSFGIKVCSPLFSCKFVKMSVCFKCNWLAIFPIWADGRASVFIAKVEGGKMFVHFLKVSYRVLNLFAKSCNKRTGRGQAQYCLFHTACVRFNDLFYGVLPLGAVLTKTNLIMIEKLTDILELNTLSDGAVDRRGLTGLFKVKPSGFPKNFMLLPYSKIAPDIIHLLEKEGITQCVYHIHL